MDKTILFRADGNATTGLGHLYRLFSLVEILKDHFDVVFLTKEESAFDVIPKDYKIEIIPELITIDKEPEWISGYFPSQYYTIIADGYHFDSTYQSAIKQLGFKLIYIDDLANEHMFADLVINHSPFLKEIDYKKEAYTELALGTKYALLRPGFLETAKKEREITNINSVFVCFGGADPYDLTLKSVKALLRVKTVGEIHVVLGGAYNHKKVFKLFEENKETIFIYRNLSEDSLLKLMEVSHFAIAPASTILYELCCVKMPILSGYFVENQKLVYKGFSQKLVIYPGGDFASYTTKEFEAKINLAIETIETTNYIKNQNQLFDNRIKERLLSKIKKVQINWEFRIRKATKEDLLLFFDWANDSFTREMSFNKDKISIEVHTEWFNNQLNSNNNFLLVLEHSDKHQIQPIGQVKFNSEGVIGISIDEKFRGMNLGLDLIRHGISYIKSYSAFEEITAYIKKNNIGSKKVFEKAGFIYSSDFLVNGEECFKYICKLLRD